MSGQRPHGTCGTGDEDGLTWSELSYFVQRHRRRGGRDEVRCCQSRIHSLGPWLNRLVGRAHAHGPAAIDGESHTGPSNHHLRTRLEAIRFQHDT